MIIAKTIEEAWFLACRECMESGYTYTIERGSFEGHRRKQLPHLAIEITEPQTRPLAVFYKGHAIFTDQQIEDYFISYMFTPQRKADKEEYTYADRIWDYLHYITGMLSETPYTNQATISIARPGDSCLKDPPCLREISWKVNPEGLQLTSFWRSWDGRNAFHINVGGLQLLNEYVAFHSGLKTGSQVLYSDGFHIYDMSWKDFE